MFIPNLVPQKLSSIFISVAKEAKLLVRLHKTFLQPLVLKLGISHSPETKVQTLSRYLFSGPGKSQGLIYKQRRH